MKYYLIYELTKAGTKKTYPTYIVERKSTAEAFCKEFTSFYFEEREDWGCICGFGTELIISQGVWN